MRSAAWILFFLSLSGLTGASAQSNPRTGRGLTGSWKIQVTIPPGSSACPAGPSPCVFFALATATGDGLVIQTAALPATSTGHGTWTRTGPRKFVIRSSYFRLDPNGFAVGTAETSSAVELSEDGLRATGTYENKVLDINGTQVGEFSAAVTAVRMTP